MKRIEKFDPILNFYKINFNKDLRDLQNESGYKYNSLYRCNQWLADKIIELNSIGYSAGKYHDCNGGDNDFLVIDHKTKKYEFGECGFSLPKSIK
jgi:hypothetical protein